MTAMTRDEAQRRYRQVQWALQRALLECNDRHGLFTTFNMSAAGLVWVSWDGRLDVGYWVGTGIVVGGTDEHPTGSGYATVEWLDGSDETATHDVRRTVLHVRDIPANAVGDGSPLAQMVVNALLAEPGADPLTNTRKD